jgi:excinuclease ABC subunit A
LAFDTLYAEGQRRYIESLSAYARQFLGQLAKPDVDQITGLSPAIAIQQKSGGYNPRSTVSTVTGIYDFLRVLYARIGQQHCPQCGRKITAQTSEAIVARILALPGDVPVVIMAPVIRGQKGEHLDLLDDLRRAGYIRARIDGAIYHLDSAPKLERNNRHNIEVVIDRLKINKSARPRLAEAVENALESSDGTLIVAPADGEKTKTNNNFTTELLLSSKYACKHCGTGFETPSPQLFSFNSPTGMCLECDGMGIAYDFEPELLIPDKSLNFYAPCIVPMRHRPGRWRRHVYEGVAKHVGFDIRLPWNRLPQKARDALLYGTGDRHISFVWRYGGKTWKHGGIFEGVIEELNSKYRQAKAGFVRKYYEKFMRHRRCEECGGARLNQQARAVDINGLALPELCALTVNKAREFFHSLKLNPIQSLIAAEVLKEVRGRLEFLSNVGLDYLTLDRSAPSLSGGESQRIRLAGQIGCGLVGVLYVLDEPTIGLHPRDNQQLLKSLKRLRDMGNTVIVVEHDEQTMRAADLIVDFGPGPGIRGGKIVATGNLNQIAKTKKSITGQYISGNKEIEIPKQRRPVNMSIMTGQGKKRKKTFSNRKNGMTKKQKHKTVDHEACLRFARLCEINQEMMDKTTPAEQDRMRQTNLAAARGPIKNFELLCDMIHAVNELRNTQNTRE